MNTVIARLRQNLSVFGFRPISGEPTESVALPAFVVYVRNGKATPLARGSLRIEETIAIDFLMPRNDPARAYVALTALILPVTRQIWQMWENGEFGLIESIRVTYEIAEVDWAGSKTLALVFSLLVAYPLSAFSELSA